MRRWRDAHPPPHPRFTLASLPPHLPLTHILPTAPKHDRIKSNFFLFYRPLGGSMIFFLGGSSGQGRGGSDPQWISQVRIRWGWRDAACFCGQDFQLARSWRDAGVAGETLVRRWRDAGGTLARRWRDVGETLVRRW